MVANTKPPPPPAYAMDGAIAVCERCRHAMGVERSLWGLANAEADHALTCGGSMFLTEDGKKRLDSVAPAPREWRPGDPPRRPAPTPVPGPGILGSR